MENVEKGLIFNVQRYQVHDGPGIRTIVFLKGCPCGCLWCSNPEGQNRNPELFFIKSKCHLCGKCIDLCPQHANAIIDNNMIVDRQICQNCGKCVDICPHSAREIKGVYKSITEIINEIEKDRSFYFISGGGVTIAGGEPLSQPEFSRNLIKRCKSLGIQTAIETSGYGSWVDLERIIPHLDWIFYDVKLLNNQNHKKYTGVYNSLILDNAVKLSQALENTGRHFTIRIPVIPGINNNKKNIRAIVEFFKKNLKAANEIEILKYHNFALGKYEALGRKYKLSNIEITPEIEMLEVKKQIEELGIPCKYQGICSEGSVGAG